MTTPASIISLLETPTKNFQCVEILGLRVWFSYRQPIAFCEHGTNKLFYSLGPHKRVTARHVEALTARQEYLVTGVHPNIFSAWLYEQLRDAIRTYSF